MYAIKNIVCNWIDVKISVDNCLIIDWKIDSYKYIVWNCNWGRKKIDNCLKNLATYIIVWKLWVWNWNLIDNCWTSNLLHMPIVNSPNPY